MPRIPDHLTLLPKRIQRMPRNEPCRLDLVLVEKLQKATDADGASEDSYPWMSVDHACMRRLCTNLRPTSRDIAGRVFPTIRAQPASHGVNVDGKAAESACRFV